MPTIEILTVGDELVEGRLVDTNAAWLSETLLSLGLSVTRHGSVGDAPEELAQALREAADRAAALIVTGGLGPTTDDLTAECAAQAFEAPLQLYPEALEHVRSFYAARSWPMPPSNERQAWLPEGATLLPNPWGTATPFVVEALGCRCYFLPGVPREVKGIVPTSVLPELASRFEADPPAVATLKVFGRGESDVGQRLAGLGDGLPEGTTLLVQYRATMPEVHVRLVLGGGDASERPALLAEIGDEAEARLRPYVFARGGARVDTTLPEVVLREARDAGATLATAESCTGGLVGQLLTSVPGSSDVYLGGVVSYSNEAKRGLLEVPAALLERHGTVSQEVAEAMARGALRALGASHAVSITGIAGPGGGTKEKPVGTVWVATASPGGVYSKRLALPFDRQRVRRMAGHSALALLRRSLRSSEG